MNKITIAVIALLSVTSATSLQREFPAKNAGRAQMDLDEMYSFGEADQMKQELAQAKKESAEF